MTAGSIGGSGCKGLPEIRGEKVDDTAADAPDAQAKRFLCIAQVVEIPSQSVVQPSVKYSLQ